MPPPVVLALLACDCAARTRGRGGYDLTGVFHALNLRLPASLTFAVYFAFTGWRGAADLELLFLGPDDEPLARGPIHLPAADPLSIVEAAGTFNDVVIDRPGTYRLQIVCDDVVLAERPVLVGPG